jgi:ABC-type multidrug transport system ATPase subunit
MEEAERLSKTVVIIDKGRVVHAGDKTALVGNHSLEQKFLEITRNTPDE